MPSSTVRPTVTRTTAALLVAVLGVLVGGCSDGGGSSGASSASSSASSVPSSGSSGGTGVPLAPRPFSNDDLPRTGPAAPRTGADFGAFVEPALFTEQGRIAAVEQFQATLGQPLRIVHDFHPWTDPFPSAMDEHFAAAGATVLLSWAGTDTQRIVSGADDALIRRRAQAVKAWGAPVLLRWRWEMDRPNLAAQIGSPAAYVAAWKHVRAVFREQGVTNAAWVWCPLAEGFASGRAQAYYPGDDEVDWLCADVYATSPSLTPEQAAGPFLAWARDRPQPVVLAEVGVTGGTAAARAGWVSGLAALVAATPQVKGVVWFESHSTAAGQQDVDFRLAADPRTLSALRTALTRGLSPG